METLLDFKKEAHCVVEFWNLNQPDDIDTSGNSVDLCSERAAALFGECLIRLNGLWARFYGDDRLKSAFDWTKAHQRPFVQQPLFGWHIHARHWKLSPYMQTCSRDKQQLKTHLFALNAPLKEKASLLWPGRLDATLEELLNEAPTPLDVLIVSTLKLMRTSTLADCSLLCQWAAHRGWDSPLVFHLLGFKRDTIHLLHYDHEDMQQRAMGACHFFRNAIMGTDLQWAMLHSDPQIGLFLIRMWAVVSKEMREWVHSVLYDMAKSQFVRRGPKPAYAIPTPHDQIDHHLGSMYLSELFGVWMAGHVLHSTLSNVDTETSKSRKILKLTCSDAHSDFTEDGPTSGVCTYPCWRVSRPTSGLDNKVYETFLEALRQSHQKIVIVGGSWEWHHVTRADLEYTINMHRAKEAYGEYNFCDMCACTNMSHLRFSSTFRDHGIGQWDMSHKMRYFATLVSYRPLHLYGMGPVIATEQDVLMFFGERVFCRFQSLLRCARGSDPYDRIELVLTYKDTPKSDGAFPRRRFGLYQCPPESGALFQQALLDAVRSEMEHYIFQDDDFSSVKRRAIQWNPDRVDYPSHMPSFDSVTRDDTMTACRHPRKQGAFVVEWKRKRHGLDM